MSETYRQPAREKRRAVIAFSTSAARIAGPLFGALIAGAMLYAWLFTGERDVHFRCTRDERGAGACEHVVRYVAVDRRETFDVRSVRGARVQMGQGKSGPTYRTFVNVGGVEHAMGQTSPDPEQSSFAAAIDAFARDGSARTLDVGYECRQLTLSTVFTLFFVGLGVAIIIGTRRIAGPRRLVLDEAANVATLEQKVFFRWRKLWAVELDSVVGARHVRDKKGFINVVIDTKNDGALVADTAVPKSDATVSEVTRFLRRE